MKKTMLPEEVSPTYMVESLFFQSLLHNSLWHSLSESKFAIVQMDQFLQTKMTMTILRGIPNILNIPNIQKNSVIKNSKSTFFRRNLLLILILKNNTVLLYYYFLTILIHFHSHFHFQIHFHFLIDFQMHFLMHLDLHPYNPHQFVYRLIHYPCQ